MEFFVSTYTPTLPSDAESQTGNSNLDYALVYARAGWPVLPIRPGEKTPLTRHGLKDASTDESAIRNWWTTDPNVNVAVRTGGDSGVFVLDIDCKNGVDGKASLRELEAEYGPLPATLRADTPSGGLHLFFRTDRPVRNRVGFRDGLDIRGDNGYVLVAPSTVDGKRYAWVDPTVPIAEAPESLYSVLEDKATSAKPGSKVPASSVLDGVTEGSRNDTMFRYASSLRAQARPYKEAEVLVLHAADNCTPAFPQAEAISCLDSAYKRYDPSTSRALTEMGNSERFVDHFGKNARYVSGEDAWIHWNDGRWKFDHTNVATQAAKTVVRNIEIEAAAETDPTKQVAIRKHAFASEKARMLKNMVDLATSDPQIQLESSKLDADPDLLGVANGVVDLRTGKLRPAEKDDFITKHSPVNYDAEAQCSLWDRFMLSITGDNAGMAAFLQRCIGYSLTGHTNEQKLFILHGNGSNGKSTFIERLAELFGTYGLSTDPSLFTLSRYGQSSGPREDVARLRGARFVHTSEVAEGQVLDEDLVKRLTGGEMMVARLPYAKHSISFMPVLKPWMETNHVPIIRNDDYGIWRRVELIPFEQKFKGKRKDLNLRKKLESEMSGILNWAIEGCLEWRRVGLNSPKQVAAATDDYRDEMDILAPWLDECCQLAADAWTSTRDLYQKYALWARTESCVGQPMNLQMFGRKLKTKGFERKKRSGVRGFQGLGINWGWFSQAQEVAQGST